METDIRTQNGIWDFEGKLETFGVSLEPLVLRSLQVNLTKLCNQACHHCHVDASPRRTEQMDARTVDRCLEILAKHDSITSIDLTGGAPELHPQFEYVVARARSMGKHVMVRHNLTVTIDGHPVTGESRRHLPTLFSDHGVEVIASLPCYLEQNTDSQRGKGVFAKSIESLRMLNEAGYGIEDSKLILNLVYNPLGPSLPPPQSKLETEYKRELWNRYGIRFTKLFTIANMPIHRFKDMLDRSSSLEGYMTLLVNAFNPAAARDVMCRSLLSVGYDGGLFDCDFNQMLEMPIGGANPQTVFDFDIEKLFSRKIVVGAHCFGCTAGAGSSCGGAIVG